MHVLQERRPVHVVQIQKTGIAVELLFIYIILARGPMKNTNFVKHWFPGGYKVQNGYFWNKGYGQGHNVIYLGSGVARHRKVGGGAQTFFFQKREKPKKRSQRRKSKSEDRVLWIGIIL